MSGVGYLSKRRLVLTFPLNLSLMRGKPASLIRSKIEIHELCVLISFADPVANQLIMF